MQVKVENNSDGNLTISVEGSIDTVTAADFEKQVKEALNGAKNLVLDFEKVEYVSSAGLRAIISLNSIMEEQGKMVVKNVSEDVNEVFEMTGFDEILNIE